MEVILGTPDGTDAQQEFFMACYDRLRELYPGGVYDKLPPANTAYPFIYVADAGKTGGMTKTAPLGRIRQEFRAWHDNRDKRGTLSTMIGMCIEVGGTITATDHYFYQFKDSDCTITTDGSVTPALLMGTASISVQYTRRH